MSHAASLGKSISGEGISKGKGHGVGVYWIYSRTSKEVSVAGAE